MAEPHTTKEEVRYQNSRRKKEQVNFQGEEGCPTGRASSPMITVPKELSSKMLDPESNISQAMEAAEDEGRNSVIKLLEDLDSGLWEYQEYESGSDAEAAFALEGPGQRIEVEVYGPGDVSVYRE